jgi:tetratricopeptide (TPR) repeat protein
MLNQGSLGGFLHSLGFGRGYARGTNRTAGGPVPPDPEEAARYFQPLPVEAEELEPNPSLVRLNRMNRLLRPRALRWISAFFWVFRRKIARLHRALPLWLVAFFYLVVAGGLCYFLARPLLDRPQAAEVAPLPERPVVKTDLPTALGQVSQLIAEKNFGSAREELQKLEAEYPDDVRVVMAKGAIYAGERSYPEAYAAFQKALDLSPTSAAALMNLAEIEFVMGKYSDAEANYRKLLKGQTKNPLVPFRLYLCAQLRHDPAAADEYLSHPAIIAQSMEWYYMTAARELFAGKKEEGRKILEQARLLFGEKARPYDRTFVRLGLIPDAPNN